MNWRLFNQGIVVGCLLTLTWHDLYHGNLRSGGVWLIFAVYVGYLAVTREWKYSEPK